MLRKLTDQNHMTALLFGEGSLQTPLPFCLNHGFRSFANSKSSAAFALLTPLAVLFNLPLCSNQEILANPVSQLNPNIL
jgi:hypothetical protein